MFAFAAALAVRRGKYFHGSSDGHGVNADSSINPVAGLLHIRSKRSPQFFLLRCRDDSRLQMRGARSSYSVVEAGRGTRSQGTMHPLTRRLPCYRHDRSDSFLLPLEKLRTGALH